MAVYSVVDLHPFLYRVLLMLLRFTNLTPLRIELVKHSNHMTKLTVQVNVLLTHSADPTLENRTHKTPLDMACEFGKCKVRARNSS